MKIRSKLWKNKWKLVSYAKIIESDIDGCCGSDREPLSSLWCASLSEAMGSWYKEGMKILDYGCGYGRYFNFLTGRLLNFTYYGLESPDSKKKHGQKCIDFAKNTFGKDKRGKFGLIGEQLEEESLKAAEIILLGSVFTHLDFAMFDKLFGKFIPSINNRSIVVFSIILGNVYKCVGPGSYGMSNCYAHTTYTKQQILSYCHKRGLKAIEAEHFQTDNQFYHTIYRIEK